MCGVFSFLKAAIFLLQFTSMKITHSTLTNGLRTIFVNVPDAPTVTVLTLIAAGSRREKPEEHGLAHFLEHMCFKGTTTRAKAIDIARELENLGAENNAFTGKGYTGYYAKAAAKHAPKLLDVIADLYLNPLFPEDEIEKEKGVIVEEINMYDDMPKSVVDDVYNVTMFGDTPAGRTIIGTKESVRSFTRDQIITFRKRNYHAGSTIVVVSGAFDTAVMKKEIAKRFASVPKGKLVKEPAFGLAAANVAVASKEKPSEQTHLIIGVPSVSLHAKDDAPLRVLATILGGGMSSRLFQRLREELGLCYYIYANQDAHETYGDFSIGAGIPHGKEADVIREVRAVLADMKTTLVSESELSIAKNYMAGNFLMGLEASDDLAFYFGLRAAHNLPAALPASRVRELQLVTAPDVRRVAKKLFDSTKFRAALVTPHADQKALAELLTAPLQ